ncbi:hypothetical protein [Stutzerimonas stutzeri]|uniref:hypothetical protein n=2 Tax=Pseudomonadaceae TaxID=135621 RepID=UPI003D9FBA7C
MPTEMQLDSPVSSSKNSGMVVGALVGGGPYGTYLEFRHLATGKVYGWGAKDYYSAWLPAGEYEVSQLGARQGVMGPYSAPLHFDVEQGSINYLGEMIYGCRPPSRPAALYGVKYCGFLALGTCTVSYPSVGICVVDRKEQAVRTFLIQHPDYASMPVRPAVMSSGEMRGSR